MREIERVEGSKRAKRGRERMRKSKNERERARE